MEALQRAVEALGEALGQAPPTLAPISTTRERGEGAISLIITQVGCLRRFCPALPATAGSLADMLAGIRADCTAAAFTAYLTSLAHHRGGRILLLRIASTAAAMHQPQHRPHRCEHVREKDHEDLSGGLFEDEDTRVFYEDLPDLQDLVPQASRSLHLPSRILPREAAIKRETLPIVRLETQVHPRMPCRRESRLRRPPIRSSPWRQT